MARGRFVVIEGIDGSGTTTQTGMLVSRLRTDGITARATREPSGGPLGALIRQILTGRVALPSGAASGESRGSWATMALLFAADRMDHIGWEIDPALRNGEFIVSDRYLPSSLAYQSLTAPSDVEAPLEWVTSLNRMAIRPEVTIVLDVPPDVAAQRRDQRGEPEQMYERLELQRRLAAFYRDLPRTMPNDNVVVIDGMGLPTDVHARIVSVVRERYNSLPPPPPPPPPPASRRSGA